MDYEVKYKEALERARQFSEHPLQEDSATIVEYIFPELTESEDERTRKVLIENFKFFGGDYPETSKWGKDDDLLVTDILAWLEKQGKQKQTWEPSAAQLIVIKDLIEDKNTSKVNKTILRGLLDEFKQFTNSHKREIDDAYLQGICDAKHEIEKQGKKDPCIGCTNDKGCVTCVDGNMKETIKSKFKVGDWVLNNVCFPMQIASIKDGMYVFTKGDAISVSFVDENYHLWTIQDATDGDVLVSSEGRPFIFSGKYDDMNSGNPIAYCGVNCQNKFKIGNGTHWTNKNEVAPATKEQCDQLFAKMRESGYEWDAEKKELKKIEPKKLDADKVIAWLVANIVDFEYYVKLFKKDFKL